jgi:thiol-disulfide isomerase/thioredoxin
VAGVGTGLIALAAAVVVATALGLALRRRAGRFRPSAAGRAAGPTSLTGAELGAPLGERATLVQFSTEFCATCPPTRQMLARLAETAEGVTYVDIDAAARLDLARRLRISSTPTVLVLDPDGVVVGRAVGQPRKADVIAALGAAGAAGTAPGTAGTPAAESAIARPT